MELPKIYKGSVKESNNLRVAHAKDSIDVKSVINNLFKQNKLYKQEVEVTTNNNTYKTKIIGRTNEHIITIDNQIIKIDDIINIKTR